MNATINALGSPYPGLRPFRQDESALFFGRGQQITDMLVRLEDHRFLAVVGASGCGKSSLVRAGLLPALEQGYLANTDETDPWHMVVLRPGDAPLRNLAVELVRTLRPNTSAAEIPLQTALVHAALRSGPKGLAQVVQESHLEENSHVLVLIDQFEELFRFRQQVPTPDMNGALDAGSAQREEAAEFVALFLATAAQAERPIHVIITMRSDFMGDCDAFHGLPEAINESQFLTPRLTRAQAHDAVVEPARSLGGDVEPALVNRILNQIGNSPDQLPLMQHVLMRLWNRALASGQTNTESPPPTLLLDDYKRIGELVGALDKHADDIFDKLKPEQQRIAQVMFRCLGDRNRGAGVGARDIRRPTRLQNVADVAGVSVEQIVPVVEVFRQPGINFLTPPIEVSLDADTRLDIGHESLLRHWEKLRKWVDNESQSAAIYRRLEETAQSWKKGEHLFLDQAALTYMLAWKQRELPNAAWAERYGGIFSQAMDFLQKSEQELGRREDEAMAQREQRESADREERKRQDRAKRNAWIVSLTSIGLVVSIGLAIWAVLERSAAIQSQADAKQSEADAKQSEDDAKKSEAKAKKSEALAIEKTKVAEQKTQDARLSLEAETVTKRKLTKSILAREFRDETKLLKQSLDFANPTYAPQRSTLDAVKALKKIPQLEAMAGESADDLTLAANNALRRSLALFGGVPYYSAKKQGLTNAVAADEKASNKWLVTSNADDGMLQIWEMSDKKDKFGNVMLPSNPTLLPFNDGPPRKMEVVRNFLVAQGSSGKLKIWNLGQKQPSKPVIENPEATWDSFYISPYKNLLRLRFPSADKKATNTVKLWDLRTENPPDQPVTLKGYDESSLKNSSTDFLTFSPKGKWYAIIRRSDGWPIFWDIDKKGQPEPDTGPGKERDLKRHVVNGEFTRGRDDQLVVCFSDGTVDLWQHQGKVWTLTQRKLPFTEPRDYDVFTDRQGLWAVAVPKKKKDGNPVRTEDVKTIAGGGMGGAGKHGAELFDLSKDLSNESCRSLLDRFQDINLYETHPIVVSPNGRWLLAKRYDGYQMWDLQKYSSEGAKDDNTGLVSVRIFANSRIMNLPSGESLRFSQDERWLFQAPSNYNYVLAWDLWSRNKRDEPYSSLLRGHDMSVRDYRVSGDSRWLITLGLDNTLRTWDLKNLSTSIEPREIRNPAGLSTLAITPAKDWLCVSRQDGTLRLWNPSKVAKSTLDQVHKFAETNEGEFATLRISEDGRWLLTYRKHIDAGGKADTQAKAVLWQLPKQGEPVRYCTLDVGHGTVTRLIVDPNGKWLAATFADAPKPNQKSLNSSIKIWHILVGKGKKPWQTELEPLKPEEARGDARAFDETGEWLIKETDTRIEIWHLKDRTSKGTIALSKQKDETAWTRPLVASDGKKAVVFPNSGEARLWDLQAGKKKESTRELDKSEFLRRDRFFTSANGRWLVNYDGNDFKYWDLDSIEKLKVEQQVFPKSDDNPQDKKAVGFRTLLASPDRRWLLIIDEPGKTGAGFGTLLDLGEQADRKAAPDTHQLKEGDIATAAFSSDSLRLVTTQRGATFDKDTIRVWDLRDRKKIAAATLLPAPNNPGVISGAIDFRADGVQNGPVAFSPDGDWLAVAGRDNLIRIWDLKAKTEPRILYGHTLFQPQPFVLFVTPKGEKVISVDLEREIIRTSTVSTEGFLKLAEEMLGSDFISRAKK